jgi:uncharacterized protein (DUF4415 family)
MPANKRGSRRTLKSDFAKVDAHIIRVHEYRALPELTDRALRKARVHQGGRPRALHPRQAISLRLRAEVIERWRATGPGWQTRMAKRLAKVR